MKDVSATSATAQRLTEATGKGQPPFVSRQVWLSQAEFIKLKWDANYWKAQHQRSCAREAALKKELAYKEAKIRDLKQRLFGKKSEKSAAGPDQMELDSKAVKRPRGQQTGSLGPVAMNDTTVVEKGRSEIWQTMPGAVRNADGPMILSREPKTRRYSR